MLPEVLGAIGVLLFVGGFIAVIAFPPYIKHKPVAPSAWREQALLADERIEYGSFAILDPAADWKAGFLYLTNKRLIWIPENFSFARHRELPSFSVRLDLVQRVQAKNSLFGSRLTVETNDRHLEFSFAIYILPIVGNGDGRGHKKWEERLSGACRAARVDSERGESPTGRG